MARNAKPVGPKRSIKKERAAIEKELPSLGMFPPYLRSERILEKLSKRFTYEREVASGKTGVVYLLKSESNPNVVVCLKTIKPDIVDPKARAAIKETLQKECEILSPLSHKCLPTIFESDLDAEPPYYICSYHPGETFASFQEKRKQLSLTQAAFVIWSLIDVLKYLHKQGRTHCDLHSKNALISAEVMRHGVLLIDFGSGHRDSDTTSDTPNQGNVAFKDPSGQRLNRQPVDRRLAGSGFQRSDFHAFGHLLGVMEDCFVSSAPTPTRLAYRDFQQALRQDRLTDWNDVEDAFLSVLDPYRVITANEDLFRSSDGIAQAITIPVSGSVSVGEASLAVINTEVFQRLRGVRQLSFCDWFFPGANHTRFEHSIGVFGIAKRAIEALVHDSEFRDTLSPEQVRGGLLAALLHDVGHYPFAHVMEQYAAGRFSDSLKAKEAASHEALTLRLIAQDTELNEAILRYWTEEAQVHAMKTLEGHTPVLSDLLDGPIDIDKMDYLSRDSYHCGVKYGEGLDIDRLLRSLRCVDERNHLGIAEDGVSSVEGLMILQDQMLAGVYWLESIRGIISMFHAIVAHLVKMDEQKFIELVTALQGCRSDLDAVRDVFLPWANAYKGKATEKVRLVRLVTLYGNPVYRNIYTPIARYRANDEPPRSQRVNIFQTIVNVDSTTRSTLPIRWKQSRDLRVAFIEAFGEKRIDVDPIEIVIDVPCGKSRRQMLKVRGTSDQRQVDFVAVSHLSESIFTDPTRHLAPVRVYVAPELREKAGATIGSIVESAEERFFSGNSASGSDHANLV